MPVSYKGIIVGLNSILLEKEINQSAAIVQLTHAWNIYGKLGGVGGS